MGKQRGRTNGKTARKPGRRSDRTRRTGPRSVPEETRTQRAVPVEAEPADKFWEFWRLADQAHEIKRRVRTMSLAPVIGGVVVVCLLALAIGRGFKPVSGTESYGGSSPLTTQPDEAVAESPDGPTPASHNGNPPTRRDRHQEDDNQGQQDDSDDGHDDPPAVSSSDDGDNAKPGPQPVPEEGPQEELDAAGATDVAPASYTPSAPQPAAMSSDQTDRPNDARPKPIRAEAAPADPAPEAPPPTETTQPAPEASLPVEPTDPASDTTVVGLWCALEPAGPGAVGCTPGTTQVVELVDVVAHETGAVAVWCLPEVSETAITGCDETSTHFLEVTTTASVTAPPDPAESNAPGHSTPPTEPGADPTSDDTETAPSEDPAAPADWTETTDDNPAHHHCDHEEGM